jgi:hypothetical protein
MHLFNLEGCGLKKSFFVAVFFVLGITVFFGKTLAEEPKPKIVDYIVNGMILHITNDRLFVFSVIGMLELRDVTNGPSFEPEITFCLRYGVRATVHLEIVRFPNGFSYKRIKKIDLNTKCKQQIPIYPLLFTGFGRFFYTRIFYKKRGGIRFWMSPQGTLAR